MKIVLIALLAFGVSWLTTTAWAQCQKHCQDVEWTRSKDPANQLIYCLKNDTTFEGAKAGYFFHNTDHNKDDSDERKDVTIQMYEGTVCGAVCSWAWYPDSVVAGFIGPGGELQGDFPASLFTACVAP